MTYRGMQKVHNIDQQGKHKAAHRRIMGEVNCGEQTGLLGIEPKRKSGEWWATLMGNSIERRRTAMSTAAGSAGRPARRFS